MLSRFIETGLLDDLEKSIEALREATDLTAEGHPDRAGRLNNLGSALGEKYASTKDHDSLDQAISYHRTAISQTNAPLVVWIVARRRVFWCLPAACKWQEAYEAADAAIHFIPQLGRGILATSIEDMRTDIIGLQEHCPDLADKFVLLKEELGRSRDGSDDTSVSTLVSQQLNSNEQFDSIVKEIQTKPGFEDFLLAPSPSNMREAARYCPIVIINVSAFHCNALVVEHNGERHMPLPKTGSLETLEWLWDAIMNPILTELGFTQPPPNDDWPHIWWIPTGPLCKFPLHAAGYHARGTSETVMDRLNPKALLVAMEHTPGNSTLQFARQEVEVVHRICTSMNLSVVKPGQRKSKILTHLQQCNIFHFAGHSHTDEANPSMSQLLLEEGQKDPLTVSELLELNLRKESPFLAYLSTCGTGRFKDERFGDESLHLIGACQVAGFRHVIGTLWEVDDELCVDMATTIYEGIEDGAMTDKSVCLGLHNAATRLRNLWVQAGPRVRERDTKKGLSSLYRDDTQNVDGKVLKDEGMLRDALLVEEEEGESLHWVPYVHFGV
ncbi:CHAT domain-containing protein [Dactylonectria macrodidyma]|uniref:CHAT domain-containing protein n=1 Tax=Dactylonectria macrodidyma TaxID=307937 RepID=A0A9P9JAW5_9HYPO|nr:CHAT domain-containing protein [Dactylonectria macrodidyma]